MDIIASVYIERENIGGYDPEDSWSRDSYSGSISHVTARPAKNSEPLGSYRYSEITQEVNLDVKLGDTVFVVVAGYHTGDTFGTDYAADVIGVFDNADEAELLVMALNEAGSSSFSITHDGEIYHIPWNGYFESLSMLDVYPVMLGAK